VELEAIDLEDLATNGSPRSSFFETESAVRHFPSLQQDRMNPEARPRLAERIDQDMPSKRGQAITRHSLASRRMTWCIQVILDV
jgi:hypothetical protein